MAVLTDTEIQQALDSLQGWQRNGTAIQRVFRFPDFKVAMQFVNKIADAAEQANHHPDIDIRYNTITMALVSHDAGGVTQRDVRMAGTINKIAGEPRCGSSRALDRRSRFCWIVSSCSSQNLLNS